MTELTDEELKDIGIRLAFAQVAYPNAVLFKDDIPCLIAEVRRLREENYRLTKSLGMLVSGIGGIE